MTYKNKRELRLLEVSLTTITTNMELQLDLLEFGAIGKKELALP